MAIGSLEKRFRCIHTSIRTAKTMYFTYTRSNHERCVGHISIFETVFSFYPMEQENTVNINCFKHGLNNFENFDKYT